MSWLLKSDKINKVEIRRRPTFARLLRSQPSIERMRERSEVDGSAVELFCGVARAGSEVWQAVSAHAVMNETKIDSSLVEFAIIFFMVPNSRFCA